MSTLTYADIYGPQNLRSGKPSTQGQSVGTPTSARTGLMRESNVTVMMWVGLVALLILIRVLIESKG